MPPSLRHPPLLDAADLRARAIAQCTEKVAATLDGEYRVEPLPDALEWNPVALRHVYDQPAVVWRSFDAFDVILDETNQPVGFVDEDKWRSCSWRDLPRADAEALARATGLLPPTAVLAECLPGERGCLELRFASPAPGGPRVRVRVNPARMAVISIEPEETGP